MPVGPTPISALALDRIGNIFVSDTKNHTIRKIDAAGLTTTVAGRAGEFGQSDGVGSAALFSAPGSLSVDRNGNLYVMDGVDFGDECQPLCGFGGFVRRISVNGEVEDYCRGDLVAPVPCGGSI